MIDENASFLSLDQLQQHVNKLNRNDITVIDTEWEVAVLNAFSKLGNVQHEVDLGGSSRLDLYFKPASDSTNAFAADITSVSDDGYEEASPVKDFHIELRERIRKFGLSGAGFMVNIDSHPRQSMDEAQRAMIPSRGEFSKEIFTGAFKKFLQTIADNPDLPGAYAISTEKTKISLTYTPGNPFFTSHGVMYTMAKEKDRNPIFNALKAKHKQLKKSNFKGAKGIILCDGGTDMPHVQPHGSWDFQYNAKDAIFDFLRQYQSVDFVILLTPVWTDKKPWDNGPARKVELTAFANDSFPNMPESLKQSILELEKQFPEPTNTSHGARDTIKNGYDPLTFSALGGGMESKENSISISSNSVLALLAGYITQEEFFQSIQMRLPKDKEEALKSLFGYKIKNHMRIAEVEVVKRATDDDYLKFKFVHDAGTALFVVPEVTSK